MKENAWFLLASVVLSAGRNICSKKTAVDFANKSQFFFSQSALFFSAALLLMVFNLSAFCDVSVLTLIFGLIYGVLLVLSQWMFTLSLKNGNTSVCTVIYSLGFILPTVSGDCIWNEDFTFLNFIGLALALAVILFTIKKDEKQSKDKKSFVPFILVAMLSSGGLGIMQKVQQLSAVADQKAGFLIIAFLFAFLCSFIAFLFSKDAIKFNVKTVVLPSLTGMCFGGANLLNTVLAGRMKSAVFFPVQNIGTIILSALLGIIFFKEKITLKTVIIIALGISVVAVFSI